MDRIIVLDFGGQYAHLIARRIRDLGFYSEILPFDIDIEKLREKSPQGIILSGGPSSVYEEESPKVSEGFFDYLKQQGIPTLGICYGHHLIVHQLRGTIEPHDKKEYGKTELEILNPNGLFRTFEEKEIAWMSHGDQVKSLPEGFTVLAKTDTCPIAAYKDEKGIFFGV